MTKLDCSVETCLHNADHYCCKGTIVVDGNSAETTENTSCGSFDERTNDSFRNSFESPSRSIEVECEATMCEFNEDYYCVADHIGIAGSKAHYSEDTECSSFRKKD